MNNVKKIKEIIPIIFPDFYEVNTSLGYKLILLKDSEEEIDLKQNIECDDKTQLEATVNHFHIFDKVKMKDFEDVKIVGEAIARNLLIQLSKAFIDRKFIVYLDINMKDSIIIRFHQKWDDEPEYYNIEDFNTKYQVLLEFKNY